VPIKYQTAMGTPSIHDFHVSLITSFVNGQLLHLSSKPPSRDEGPKKLVAGKGPYDARQWQWAKIKLEAFLRFFCLSISLCEGRVYGYFEHTPRSFANSKLLVE